MPPNLNQITHHPEAQVVTKFNHAGLDCVVLNMKDRHYCGYVKTPFDGHFKEFEDYVDVHGGLSYGLDEDGWVGFDTAHGFDVPVLPNGSPLPNNPIAALVVGMGTNDPNQRQPREWDPEDVIEETAKLADQIAEMVPEGSLQVEEEVLEE